MLFETIGCRARGAAAALLCALAIGLAAPARAQKAAGAPGALDEGRALLEKGKLEDAIRRLEAAVREAPANADARVLLARALLQAGDLEGTEAQARSILERAPDHPQGNFYLGAALYWRARAAIDEGKVSGFVESLFHDAEGSLRKAVRGDPKSLDAEQYLGLVHYYQQGYEEALRDFARCIEIAPEDPFAHFQTGEILQVQQRYEEAIPHYRRAVELNPKYTEAHRKIGLCNEFLGKTEAAAEAYRSAILTAPGYLEPYKDIWRLYGEGDRLAKGAACMRALAEKLPDHYQVHWYLAHFLARMKKTKEAVAEFRKVLDLNPNASGAYLEIGNLLVEGGETDEAIRTLKKGLAAERGRNPDLVPEESPIFQKLMDLSGVLGSARKFDEASKLLLDLDKLSPENGYVWSNLGLVYRDWGKYDEARAAYKKAAQLLPYDAQVINDYGVVLDYHFGRTEEAFHLYRKAVEISENVDAIENLARYYLHTGQFEECVRMADRGLKLEPNRLALRRYRSEAEAKRGKDPRDPDEAH